MAIENKIKMFLIKSQMKKDLMEIKIRAMMERARILAGKNYIKEDPFNEENWSE